MLYEVITSPDSVDQYNPKCIQASMGAIARVKVIYTSLPALIKEVAAKGIPVYGTLLDGDNIYNRKSEKSGIILFGNESRGVITSYSIHYTKLYELLRPP